MSTLAIGLLIIFVLVFLLLAGLPVAFALGSVAILFLIVFDGVSSVDVIADILFGSLGEFALLSIPMFILMGSAIASSRAGSDLYEALERWFYKVPGGLIISNIGACSIFAALSGSSPATCAAIGKMGIPEMQKRGYPDSLATGAIAAGGTLGILIPPSITMIVYGIATETSIGRLFMAGIIPGIMLTGLFMAWSLYYANSKGFNFKIGDKAYSWKEKFEILPKILPFLLIIAFILYALYGGIATPSEAAGVGAFVCVALVVLIYKMWNWREHWTILKSSMRESVMILMIIGAAALFSYMMSSLYITQSLAEWIVTLDVNPWVLLLSINVFLILAGLFLPPVAVIIMTAPTLLPMVEMIGFDPVWFGVMLTLNMEIGLITPPVGLNLYVINSIAPDVKLPTILWGALPFMICMLIGIALLIMFPGLATWLPDYMMGPAQY